MAANSVQFWDGSDPNPWDAGAPTVVSSQYAENHIEIPGNAPDIHVRVYTRYDTTEDIHVNWSLGPGTTAQEGVHFNWGSILGPPAYPPTPQGPGEDLVILHSWTDTTTDPPTLHEPRRGERIRFTPIHVLGPSPDVVVQLQLDGITQGDADLGPKKTHNITLYDAGAQGELDLCPTRENLTLASRAVATFDQRNVIARQLNQPQLRTWTLEWDLASDGIVMILEDQIRSSRGPVQTFSFVTHDAIPETVPRVRFVEDTFAVTQVSFGRWSVSVDVEEVR